MASSRKGKRDFLPQPGDAFGDGARRLTQTGVQAVAWLDLFDQARHVRGSRPSAVWQRQMRALIDAMGAPGYASALKTLFAQASETPLDANRSAELLNGANGELLKGLVWSVVTLDDAMIDDLVTLCRAMSTKVRYRGARSAKVVTACINALGHLGETRNDAAWVLLDLQMSLDYDGGVSAASKAMEEIAKARSISSSDELRALLTSWHRERTAIDADDEEACRDALVDAEQALEKSAHEAALEALLDAWRIIPATELARAMEALSQRLRGNKASLRERSQKATLKRFANAARRCTAGDIELLLEVVPTGRWDNVLEQVTLLSHLGRDPRIAGKLTELVVDPKFTANGSIALWRRVYQELLVHLDPRSVAPIEAVVKGYASRFIDGYRARDWVGPQIAQLAEQLEARSYPDATLEGQAASIAQRILAHLGVSSDADAPAKTGVETEELLEAIYADPADDQLRAVYADRLAEQDDPRGELITLQLQAEEAPLSRKQRARQRELLDTWGRDWLGDLDPVLLKGGLEYRRGFPARGRVELRGEHHTKRVVDDPAWATFESLEFIYPQHSDVLLENPALGGLREVYNITTQCGLKLLQGKARPLRLLHMDGWGAFHMWAQARGSGQVGTGTELLAAFDDPRGTPELETLWFGQPINRSAPSADDVRVLQRTRLGAGLRRLTLAVENNQLTPWLLQLNHASDLRIPEIELRPRMHDLRAISGWPALYRPETRELDADLRGVDKLLLPTAVDCLCGALEALTPDPGSTTRHLRSLRVTFKATVKRYPSELRQPLQRLQNATAALLLGHSEFLGLD